MRAGLNVALVFLLMLAGCGGGDSASSAPAGGSSSANPAAAAPADVHAPPGDPSKLPKVPATFDAISQMLRDRFTEPVVRNVRVGIDTTTSGISVSLTGEVPNEEIRQAVMNEVAARVEGLKNQDFNLDVAGPIPMLWNFDIPRLDTTSAIFSPDLSLTVTRYGSIFETATGRRINRIASGDETLIESIAMSPDQKLLATGTKYGKIDLWRLPQGEFIKQIKPQANETNDIYKIAALAFTHDNKQLAAIYRRHGEIHMFDLQTGSSRLIAAHKPNSEPAEDSDPYTMVISPDDKLIATIYFSGNGIDIFDINARARKETLEPDNMAPEVLTWSHNGKFIAAGRHFRDPDQAVCVIDLATKKSTYLRDEVARSNMRGLALSPDDRTLAVMYDNSPSAVLWDIPSSKEWQTLDTSKVSPATDRNDAVAFSPDGAVLVTFCGGQRPEPGIRLWDVSKRPGSTTAIAQLPARFDNVPTRDDRLAQAIDTTIRGPGDSTRIKSLKVEALPDGSIKLTGKVHDQLDKRDIGWIAESLHLSDDPDQNAKRKVINEMATETTYPAPEPPIIGK